MSKPEETKESTAAVFEDDDFDFGTKPADQPADNASKKEDTKLEGDAEINDPVDEKPSDIKTDEATAKDADVDTSKDETTKEEEKVTDPFAIDSEDTTEEGKLSLKKLASGLEVDLEKDDVEEFTAKVKQKIEAARQEFKLDDYPDDAKAIIKHLKENDGKIEDFFNNKNIVSLQSVINLDAEQKVREVRINELKSAGIPIDKAREQADEEIEALSTREIKNHADKIDEDARKLISKEISQITGDRKAAAEQKRAAELKEIEKQVGEIKEYVKSQKDFLGIPLTDKAKQNIMRDIETGSFDRIANETPASSKFAAYMMAKFGKNILETIKKTAGEQNRKGYNAANEKHLNALHKTKDSAQQAKSGHQQGKTGETGRFDGFLGSVDED